MTKFLLKTILFLCLIFVAVICLVLAHSDYRKVKETKTWQRLNAIVTAVTIAEVPRRKGTTFCPKISVTFELAGNVHTSLLEISQQPCSTIRKKVEGATTAFAEGKTVAVYVNPASPGSVRLGTYSLGWGFYLGTVIGVFALIGAMVTPLLFRSQPIKRQNRKNTISSLHKKEIVAKVRELLNAGAQRSEVFRQFSDRGLEPSHLAYVIASYADPDRCSKHERKVNALITISIVQAVVGFLIGLGIGAKFGPNAKWVVASLVGLLPLLFAWAFYKNLVGAYNAYILLTIIQLPQSLQEFATSPVATSIALALSISVLAYAWYVRTKLFPDFGFITPRKVKGEYVFSG